MLTNRERRGSSRPSATVSDVGSCIVDPPHSMARMATGYTPSRTLIDLPELVVDHEAKIEATREM